MKVALCTPTYLRPQGLTRLMEAVDALDAPAPGVEVEIVVIDNDTEASAEALCAELAAGLRWPLVYRHEPRRGISQARNAAVAAARERAADFIAFVDDDEYPHPGWLAELMRVQAAHGADVVAGRIVREFECSVPGWMERGGYFEAPRRTTGDRVEHPGTGNVLIRVAALEGIEGPFDERFSLAGGEDTHLFLRLAREGRVMVAAEEAIVYEGVPQTRARARWILMRAYREANTWSLCERELSPTPRTVALRVAKACARIAAGAALLPAALVLGRGTLVRGLWNICWGAGNLAGLAGFRFHEYRVATHGG